MKLNIIGVLTLVALHGLNAKEEFPEKELSLQNNSSDRFVDVVNYLAENSDQDFFVAEEFEPKVLSLDVEMHTDRVHVRTGKKPGYRDYKKPYTPSEKKDLSYILITLGKSSWSEAFAESSSLNKAGDRIVHLHPLIFLQIIFTDEELKAAIAAVRGKSLIWKKFFGNLEKSFKQESKNKNVPIEYVVDFAKKIGIDPALLRSAHQEQRWKDFVNILIDNVPRQGNIGRYDM